MRQTINGADLRRMIISAAAAIEINKQALNELNVFPVPDGDTGTNMSMTINAAAGDLRKTEDPDITAASKVAASAMLRGARGNSGVILSLLFRGISKALKGCEVCDGVLWAQALQEGVDAAYKAVMKPAEGTILTVARLAAAKAADAAAENNYIEFVQEAATEEAKVALENTTNQNPVLKKAGVVDAGGKGWLIALEAMLSSMQGEDVVAESAGDGAAVKEAADFSDFNTEDITFSYCTEFIISRENDRDPEALRAILNELGDSLVLVDDEEIIKVHVHSNDPGAALHEAVNYGSFVTVKVVDKEGNLCPLAENEIRFKVKGAGSYGAGANGNSTSLESFQAPRMKVFSGMMTAIVAASERPGEIVLEASAPGLKKAVLKLQSQK